MSNEEPQNRPAWVSDELFPFNSRYFKTRSGRAMHYIDEGEGEPVVFVHGNPSWSFEFRHLVKGLRSDFRCIAPDHIGLGLSSRSSNREDHLPQAHAEVFTSLLDHLELRDITLYLSDWGGPIGLHFARNHPDRVKRLIIANTWCWPVSRDPHFVFFSFMMSSWLGQILIKRINLFVNRVVPMAVGRKDVLTPQVMEHYRNAQPTPDAHLASAALPGAIVGETKWLESIWNDRESFAHLPSLIFWGMKDIAFRRKELARWQSELANFETHEFEDCGHFIAEENPEEILPIISSFMNRA